MPLGLSMSALSFVFANVLSSLRRSSHTPPRSFAQPPISARTKSPESSCAMLRAKVKPVETTPTQTPAGVFRFLGGGSPPHEPSVVYASSPSSDDASSSPGLLHGGTTADAKRAVSAKPRARGRG